MDLEKLLPREICIQITDQLAVDETARMYKELVTQYEEYRVNWQHETGMERLQRRWKIWKLNDRYQRQSRIFQHMTEFENGVTRNRKRIIGRAKERNFGYPHGIIQRFKVVQNFCRLRQ
jgi:hypothetical protein